MRRTMLALSAAGATISGYLSVVHLTGSEPICTALSDCARVQDSAYAEVAGVPVAAFGLVAYVAFFVAVWLRAAPALPAYLAFTGVGYSGYLTWVELSVLDAVCQWCVISAALMAALAVLSARALLGHGLAALQPRS